MFSKLKSIHQRPELFSVSTIDTLWTDPHLAGQMLTYHLDENTPLASRPSSQIDEVVTWIETHAGLDTKNVCDLGCGPGLYSERFAARGATVQGVDFSENSIRYAKRNAELTGSSVIYSVADYLKDELPANQDIVTLVYCDLCALSPENRSILLGNIRNMLRPGGTLILDVFTLNAFNVRENTSHFGRNLMGEFWAAGEYFAHQNTFKYDTEKVMLDQYTIIELNRTWQVFNWLQYFGETSITNELKANGFKVSAMTPGWGHKNDDTLLCIAANAKP